MAEHEEGKARQTEKPATPSHVDRLDLSERKCAVMHVELPWEPATLHARRRDQLPADIDLATEVVEVSAKR